MSGLKTAGFDTMRAAPVAERSGSFASFIAEKLSIRTGEGRRTVLLFLHLFLASAVFILGRTVRDTLFLSRYSLSALPWMFVFYGIASSFMAILYSRVADKVTRQTSIGTTVAVGCITYLGVWGMVQLDASWVYPVFYVWSEVVANLLIVQFWTLANDLHDPRAAKRLFPVIGAARVLGVVVIGASTGVVVRVIGTAQLLFILVAMMIVIATLAFLLRTEAKVEVSAVARKGPAPSVVGNPYVRVLALLILLTFTSLTVGDYQFKAIAKATYKNDELAQFFSLFYAAVGLISFFFQIFITPRLLGRFGVGWGMSVMPGVFGAASVFLPFIPHLGIASMMKFADNGFQYTIHETSLQTLYVPFAPQVKAKTRALLDAAIKPLAYGAGGLVLVLCTPILQVTQLSYVTAGLVVVWLILIPIVKGQYLKQLQSTLSSRGIQALEEDSLIDDAGKQALKGMLESPDARQVLLAMDHAGEQNLLSSEQLGKLLSHEDSRVRTAALRRIQSVTNGELKPQVLLPLLSDADPDIRGAAAKTISSLLRDEATDYLIPLMNDSEKNVRESAIAAMLLHGGIEGDIHGGAMLAKLLGSENRDQRSEGAAILGHLGPEAYRPLLRLLKDPDPVVRRAALKAAAGVADARLVNDMLPLLNERAVRLRAGAVLIAIGQPAIAGLLTLLTEKAASRETKLHIPRLLRAIVHDETYTGLLERADVEDSHLRLRIYATLSKLREKLNRPAESLEKVRKMIEREVSEEFRKLAGWETTKKELTSALLEEELQFRQQRAIRRVLRVLELRYNPQPLRLVRERLADPKRRANAMEVLDTLMDASIRPLVMLFVDDTPILNKVAASGNWVPKPPSTDLLLKEECKHPNPYVITLAIDAACKGKHPMVEELALGLLNHEDPLVREQALYSLAAIGAPSAQKAIEGAQNDSDQVVAQHAHLLLKTLNNSSTDNTMHSTLEKILFLKSTALFAKVSSEDLAPLARVAELETFAPGATLVTEGEVGDRLFVIISGKVAVLRSGEKVATLGTGQAVGEMAVLDAEPRSATVVAEEETTALSIGSEEFYEILHEQVEIAEGVIKMLTRRLRDSNVGASSTKGIASAAN